MKYGYECISTVDHFVRLLCAFCCNDFIRDFPLKSKSAKSQCSPTIAKMTLHWGNLWLQLMNTTFTATMSHILLAYCVLFHPLFCCFLLIYLYLFSSSKSTIYQQCNVRQTKYIIPTSRIFCVWYAKFHMIVERRRRKLKGSFAFWWYLYGGCVGKFVQIHSKLHSNMHDWTQSWATKGTTLFVIDFVRANLIRRYLIRDEKRVKSRGDIDRYSWNACALNPIPCQFDGMRSKSAD